MKRSACFAAIIISLGLCVFNLIDLIFFIDIQTGFVTVGSVWIRYGALLAAIITIYILGKKYAYNEPVQELKLPVPKFFYAIGGAAFFAGAFAVSRAFAQYFTPTTNFGHVESGSASITFALTVRLAFAFALLIFYVFCLVVAVKKYVFVCKRDPVRMLGFLSIVAFCLLSALRYTENPVSMNRIMYILPVCSALAALAFLTVLIGFLHNEPSPKNGAKLAVSGLCAFLLCTCTEVVQMLFNAISGFSFYSFSVSLMLVLIGILGAIAALTVSKNNT